MTTTIAESVEPPTQLNPRGGIPSGGPLWRSSPSPS